MADEPTAPVPPPASDGPVRAFAGDLTQKLTLANLVSASIDAFERICDGEFDHYPEQAFNGLGGLDDVEAAYKKLNEK